MGRAPAAEVGSAAAKAWLQKNDRRTNVLERILSSIENYESGVESEEETLKIRLREYPAYITQSKQCQGRNQPDKPLWKAREAPPSTD
jgi:hypothetical protein